MSCKNAGTLVGILREKYENSAIVTLSSLFVFVTLCNMFIMYRLLLDVIPFPIGVTFSQLLVGMMLAYVLGGFDFNRVKEETLSKASEYAGPVGIYLLMFTIANILLKSTPVIAVYPCILALAVVLHHIFRYLFCDQRNLLSFKTVVVTALSYIVVCMDTNLVPPTLLGLSILYAISSAIFRAVCLEKALHITDRDANKLYNVQVFCGVFALFIATIIFEPEFFLSAQSKSILEIFLSLGCLVTVGTIPFVKNVIANKLVTLGQQAPWRFSEIVSVALFFVFGGFFFECDVTVITVVSFLLVITGRTMSMIDIINNDKARQSMHHRAQHSLAFNELHDDTSAEVDQPVNIDVGDGAITDVYEHEGTEHEDEEIDQEAGYIEHSSSDAEAE
ncbi:hypothetical protein cand_004880 [Cryptosporidium andersoni]|uniref:Uncharacterized protein n=1 Tax=Cryptosporidium andersoni TaxID=117008 RepID=A0A1J4ML29_9CRYT|nr:hypothetical protein cand_004880 [Cryptosporidium andersoni]